MPLEIDGFLQNAPCRHGSGPFIYHFNTCPCEYFTSLCRSESLGGILSFFDLACGSSSPEDPHVNTVSVSKDTDIDRKGEKPLKIGFSVFEIQGFPTAELLSCGGKSHDEASCQSNRSCGGQFSRCRSDVASSTSHTEHERMPTAVVYLSIWHPRRSPHTHHPP